MLCYFHALLHNSGCKWEQLCGSNLDPPGNVFHPDYLLDKPAYFDVTVRNPLQISLLSPSAVLAGVAALRGEVEKDVQYEEAVLGAGGIFIAVKTLGLWSPASLKVLRDVAIRTTNRSGVGIALACHHFLEQFSVCLWRHNAHMFLTTSVCCLLTLCGR